MMALDTDKDGRISRAEAQAGEARVAERFDEMDVNKDGYVDRSDMQARVAQRRGECFAKADTDKNGQLSRAEFDKMGDVCGGMQAGGPRGLPRNNPNPATSPSSLSRSRRSTSTSFLKRSSRIARSSGSSCAASGSAGFHHGGRICA